jgi:CHASE2 domain-containing sensor protein
MADVVIVKMDEESLKVLHQNPNASWDRALHAQLLEELSARGARLVVFDVLFDVPSPGDDLFRAAIEKHGNVVVAASLHESQEGQLKASHLILPNSSLGSNTVWGIVEWPPSPGPEVIRNQFNLTNYPTLAWQAAKAWNNSAPEPASVRWLNFYGPSGSLPSVSYYRVLQTNSLPPDFFQGKAVYVGLSGLITSRGQTSDQHATPFSRWQGGLTSGVEIQATAFLNLIHRVWLQEFPPTIELLALLAIGLLFGLWLPKVRLGTGLIISVAMGLLTAVGAMLLAWGVHLWFPWLIICAVQIPCAIGWSLLLHTRKLAEEKQALEKSMALAEALASLPQPAGNEELPDQALANRGPSGTGPGLPPIPNHRLLRRIGQGAYGEVWIAQDQIGTYHAVKIVYQRSFDHPAPYEREFKGIQRFTPISRSHPGFVHILHVGRNDPEGYFFYIMELGDDKLGRQPIDPFNYSPNTLSAMLDGGRLSVQACLRLGLDLTAALQYLHEHQLIHRDIKPSNIVFVNRQPKFADIGLVTDVTPRGKDVSLVGTEGYIPPEGPGTIGADIYGLGKALYEACSGKDRNQFPSLSGTLIASADPSFNGFNEIILKACHSEPGQRYQSASEFHTDLLGLSRRL